MKRTASRLAALAAATAITGFAAGLATAADSAHKVALSENPVVAERPLAVMLDQPTGGRFAYFAEEGWKFVGRNGSVAEDAAALTPAAGQPASMMVDGPTGFVYTYIVDKGWQFAGSIGEQR